MSHNLHPDHVEQAMAEHAYEMGAETPADRAWYAWAAEAERLGADFLGTDAQGKPTLDGDEATDGYSLDFAHDAFERGETPNFYIATVRKERRVEGLGK